MSFLHQSLVKHTNCSMLFYSSYFSWLLYIIYIYCTVFSYFHWLRACHNYSYLGADKINFVLVVWKMCTWQMNVVFVMSIECSCIFSAVSRRNSNTIFIKNTSLILRFLLVLISIRMADFFCRMNNKRNIKFGLRRISELFRLGSAFSASLWQITLGFNSLDVVLSHIQ